MISKAVALGLVGAGCIVAAAGGAYVAVRQNAVPQPAVVSQLTLQREPAPTQAGPVAETETVIPSISDAPSAKLVPVEEPAPRPASRRARRSTARRTPRAHEAAAEPAKPATAPAPAATAAPREAAAPPPVTPIESVSAGADVSLPDPEPQLEEVVVPASAVIGLQVTTTLSSEYAEVEDRVEARVTRDVFSDGRLAIPAGSRAIGSVTLVERGGKIKERARLGVRFHTLVLADGSEIPLRTEGIYREGEAPSNESARKIGGAAIGGAILGAIIGGGKGAVVGGATGAAGGTAVVMAGGRNAATLSSGTIVTVRLSEPLTMQLLKDR